MVLSLTPVKSKQAFGRWWHFEESIGIGAQSLWILRLPQPSFHIGLVYFTEQLQSDWHATIPTLGRGRSITRAGTVEVGGLTVGGRVKRFMDYQGIV